MGNWDWSWDLVIKAVGLLTIIATFISTFIGVRKYFYEKNRDIYLRRLNEVYAPLYGYLVKQETLRKIRVPHIKREEAPILSLSKKQHKQSIEFKDGKATITTTESKEEELDIVHRNNFIKVFNETNKGLASPKLLTLINQYQILIYLEESNVHDEKWKLATETKVEVENQIIEEIIDGYIQTIKKLDIDDRHSIKIIRDLLK